MDIGQRLDENRHILVARSRATKFFGKGQRQPPLLRQHPEGFFRVSRRFFQRLNFLGRQFALHQSDYGVPDHELMVGEAERLIWHGGLLHGEFGSATDLGEAIRAAR